MANFDKFYTLVDKAADGPFDAPLDSLYDRARQLIPPMLRVWDVLAKLAVQSWDDESHEVTVVEEELTAKDFTSGNHAKLFVNHLMTVSRGEYVCDPRFQGMLLGLIAIFPYRPFGDFVSLTRRITNNLFIEVDDERIDWVASDGISNQEWDFVQNMATQWLRAWCSARKIQRGYRDHLARKRMKMIQLVLVPIIVRNN